MASKAEIRNRVLRKLGVLGVGERADTAIAAQVEAAYDDAYQRLLAKSLVTWGATEDVPKVAARPVVNIVTADCADDFRVDEGKVQRFLMEAMQAEKDLAKLLAPPYESEPTPAEYY